MVWPGAALDIDAVQLPEQPTAEQRPAGRPKGKDKGGKGKFKGSEFVTKNMLRFLARAAKEFNIVGWMRHTAPDDILKDNGDRLDIVCPNADAHSDTNDHTGFFVSNASDDADDEPGFSAWCNHENTCGKQANTSGEKSKKSDKLKQDRGWWLDKLCQKYKVEDAATLLDPWCSDAARAAWETWEAPADDATVAQQVTDAIERLNKQSTPEDVRAVLALMARRNRGIEEDNDLLAIRHRTQLGLRLLRRELRERREERAAARAPGAEVSFAENCRAIREHIEETNNPATLFMREEGGVLRLNRSGGTTRIEELDSAAWWHEMNKRCGSGGIIEGAVTYLRGDNEWDLPLFERIAKVPIFGATGTLRTEPGYDEDTRTYLVPGFEPLPLPEKVAPEDVAQALGWLREALRDFPFSDTFDGSDRLPIKLEKRDAEGWRLPNPERGVASFANCLAMILQPFVRNMIDGPCPNYHIDKARAGTGAGYLVDVAHEIFEGTRSVPQPMSDTDKEVRKAITASLRGGRNFLFIDNVNRKVTSGTLAAALTAGIWSDRLLGSSELVTTPIRCVWVMAGNNLSFTHELMRRNVPIRLDAAVPNPEHRTNDEFRHYPLHNWLRANRANLVWACHVLVAHWVQAGMRWGSARMASFDSFAGVMSGILEAAGVADFLGNVPDYLAAKDDDEGVMADLVNAWYAKWGGNRVTAGEILEAITDVLGNLTVDLPTVSNAPKSRQIEALRTVLKQEAMGVTFSVREDSRCASRSPHAEPETWLGKVVKVRDRNPIRYALIPLESPPPHAA